jgi:hypothetical protein
MTGGPHLLASVGVGDSGVGWRRLLGRLGRKNGDTGELAKEIEGRQPTLLAGSQSRNGPEEGRIKE